MQANWLTADTLRPLLELSMKECPAAGSYSGGDASSLSASRPPTGPTASAVVNLGVVGRGNKRINLQPVTAASGAPAGADAAGRCMPAQYSCSLIACRPGRSCLNQHQHLVSAWQQEYGLSRSPEAAWRTLQTKAQPALYSGAKLIWRGPLSAQLLCTYGLACWF